MWYYCSTSAASIKSPNPLNFFAENPRYKERRRRQISQAGTASSLHAPTTVEEQQRNDVRLLHEAYQFLSRKFITQEPLHSPVATAPATTKKQQKGEDGEWHLP